VPACCGSNCASCLALKVLLSDSACAATMIVQSTLRREARPSGARCLSRTIKPALSNRVIRGGSLGKHLHRSLALARVLEHVGPKTT